MTTEAYPKQIEVPNYHKLTKLWKKSKLIKPTKILKLEKANSINEATYQEVPTIISIEIPEITYEFYYKNLEKYKTVYKIKENTVDELLTMRIKKFLSSFNKEMT